MKVPAERLRHVLGITDVRFQGGKHALAIVDSPLAGENVMGAIADSQLVRRV
jgi:hypothetical protein